MLQERIQTQRRIYSMSPFTLLFRCSVTSNSLWHHGLQQARLPCPSLSPGVCWNWYPLSQLCHPTTSPSAAPFSSCPQFFPAFPSLFQWVVSSHQVAKISKVQLQHQSFQWIFGIDFLSDWLVWFPCCPRNSQEFSPAPQSSFIENSKKCIIIL